MASNFLGYIFLGHGGEEQPAEENTEEGKGVIGVESQLVTYFWFTLSGKCTYPPGVNMVISKGSKTYHSLLHQPRSA